MLTGIILKGVGSFYDVSAEGKIIRCRARGRLRKQGIVPMAGDRVAILPGNETTEASIEEILPRRNFMIRPPVANIDHLAVVIAAASPDPDLLLADKLLISAELNDIKPFLVFNKIDLVSSEALGELIEEYANTGYPFFCVSGKFGTGMQELGRSLEGITTLAGQSGAGKSSIINNLQTQAEMEVGLISEKVKRGKHTTRHVELLMMPGGGMVADTPGFSQMDLYTIKPEELQNYYPEFRRYADDCRFNGCLHYREPQCAVRDNVEKGNISRGRYDRYIRLLNDIRENRRNTW